ncbi:MAG: ribonuclease HI [Candidatus Paceibacteria bacterium]|jgi:ribonuclease HI
MEHIVIFTDGASRGNPGAGGYGTVLVSLVGKQVWEFGEREDNTTNNRMEMSAIIRGLAEVEKIVSRDYEITIYTDSKYVIQGATAWVFGWQKNDWKTKNKTDVLNKDLWEKVAVLIQNKKINWEHVPGHSGIPGNERVDEIGTKLADKEAVELYKGSLENYFVKDILNTDYDASLVKEKKSGKAHSYVSEVGGVVKTHTEWTSCKIRVDGKKARFKKVFSVDEEKALIDEWSS